MLADDIIPHGYQRTYREGLDEERRSFSGDQEPIGTEAQSFYKRSNGLKYIGLGKRGQDQEPIGFETQNFYKRSNGLKYIGLGKRGQNGQKKKNSGMKYIGLGKRD